MRSLLLLVVLAVLAAPSTASAAYTHVDACKSSLRGYGGSDDDIHREGVLIGASSFAGFGTYWHSGGDVYIYVRFNGGYVSQTLARCWGGDYRYDGFV